MTQAARPAAALADPSEEDGLKRRRLEVLLRIIRRDFDGETRPLKLAKFMADRYRWPWLRTLSDVRALRDQGLVRA